LEAKVIELLKSILITKEKDVNYEEFMKIVNKETSKEKSGISGFAKFLKSGFRKK
jgi:hypothetical protein